MFNLILNYFLRILGRVLKWVIYIGLALTLVVAIVAFFAIRAFISPPSDQFGNVDDEAKLAGLTVDDFPGADEPYFAAMDHGLLLKEGPDFAPEVLQVANDLGIDPEEVRQRAIRGQNMWIAWTGGNDRFWDFAALNTIGVFDLLKLISNHPSQAYGRHNRFRYNGMINEPCYERGSSPRDDRFGLYLDVRSDECGDDPFENQDKYPGVTIGARGEAHLPGLDGLR